MVGYDDGAFASDVDPIVVVIVPCWHSVLEVDAMTVAGADDVMIIVLDVIIIVLVIVIVIVIVVVNVVIVVVVVVVIIVVIVIIIVALASFPIIVAGDNVPIMMSR